MIKFNINSRKKYDSINKAYYISYNNIDSIKISNMILRHIPNDLDIIQSKITNKITNKKVVDNLVFQST